MRGGGEEFRKSGMMSGAPVQITRVGLIRNVSKLGLF